METFLQYLQRKITGKTLDKSKKSFSYRVKQNVFYRLFFTPHKLIATLKDNNNDLQNRLALIENAIIDPQGLGGLDLKLHNAHIPQRYYEIFYKLPFIVESHKNSYKIANGGGQNT